MIKIQLKSSEEMEKRILTFVGTERMYATVSTCFPPFISININEGVCTYLVGVVGWTAAKDIVGKGDLNSLSVSWFILASDLRSDEDFLCLHRIVSGSKERRTDFFFVIIKITQHNEDNTAYFHSFTGSCKLQ